MISDYTREAGVRQLEREIGKLARKAARRIASGAEERARWREKQVREFLGRSRVHPEKAGGENLVGVATGMYYTPMGGDIMFIEVGAAAQRIAPPPPSEPEQRRRRGWATWCSPASSAT